MLNENQSTTGEHKWASIFRGLMTPIFGEWVIPRDCTLYAGMYWVPGPSSKSSTQVEHGQPREGWSLPCPVWEAETVERAVEHDLPNQCPRTEDSMGLGQGWGERPRQDPGSKRQGAGNCKHVPGSQWEASAHAASSHWTSVTKHKCRKNYEEFQDGIHRTRISEGWAPCDYTSLWSMKPALPTPHNGLPSLDLSPSCRTFSLLPSKVILQSHSKLI